MQKKILDTNGKTAGQATLQAIIAMSVVLVSTYFMSTFIVQAKQKVLSLNSYMELKTAIQSSVDFVIFGIKRKYCFDSVMLQDVNCDMNHPASVERLLMSMDREAFIRRMIAAGQYTTLTAATKANPQISVINKTILFSSLSSAHPLYLITQSSALRSVASGIHIVIARNDSMYLPKYGGETYLTLTVEMIGANGETPLIAGNKKMKIISTLSVHPREIGSFALLVPQDLHLDQDYNATMATGDVSLHNFSGNEAVKASKSQGLNFLSPVFVNRNIYLPTSDTYTPVTFSNKVITGNGLLFSANDPFTPASPGLSQDQLWSTQNNMGGFLKGLDNDDALDKGLLVLAGITNANPVDTTLMQQCIARTQSLTNNSILLASLLSSLIQNKNTSGSSGTLRLQLSNGNVFSDQFTSTGNSLLQNPSTLNNIDYTSWTSHGGSFSRKSLSNIYSTAVSTMELTLNDGNQNLKLTADLARQINLTNANNEFVEITFPTSGAQTLLSNLQPTATSYQNTIDTNNATITQNNADITSKTADITTKTADIASKNAQIALLDPKVTTDATKIAVLQNDIKTLQNSIDTLNADISTLTNQIAVLKNTVSTATASLASVQTQINSYQNLVDNPGKIKIQINPLTSTNGDNYAKRRHRANKDNVAIKGNQVDLVYDISNPNSMITTTGQPYNFSLKIQAYDLTYETKTPITISPITHLPTANQNLSGYLNFGRNGFNFNVPSNIANSSSVSTAVAATEDATDYDTIDANCEKMRSTQGSQSFGLADPTTDFSASTRISWNFAGFSDSTPPASGLNPVPALISQIDFDSTNSLSTNTLFQVRSIVGNCIIHSDAQIVTGFFTCDKLTIQNRTTPLRIIASIIANKLDIDPNALKTGILWSSIYYPQATAELRNLNILTPLIPNTGCNATSVTSATPIWHPFPAIQDYENFEKCNVGSLRAKADPFRWSSVDPDCGVIPGNSATTCKYTIVNFLVFEHSREADL